MNWIKDIFRGLKKSPEERAKETTELEGKNLIHKQLEELISKCQDTIRGLTRNPNKNDIQLKNVHTRLMNTLPHLQEAHSFFKEFNKKNKNLIIEEIKTANTIINDTSISKRVLAGLVPLMSKEDMENVYFIKENILKPIKSLEELKNEI